MRHVWLRIACLGGLALALVGGGAHAQNDPVSLRSEAFEAAQLAISSDAADALAKMSARFAVGGGDIAPLAREREALIETRARLERQIEDLYAGGADANPKRQALRQDYEKAGADLAALDRTIAARFPAYSELTNPQALALKDAQALLGPNEAMLFVLANPEASYVWGLSREKVVWARATNLGQTELESRVRRLRASLNLAGEDRGPTSEPGQTRATRVGRQVSGGPPPFDFLAANELYVGLVKPVEAAFEGKDTLITVTSGALSALPLAVLVSQPPSTPSTDASTFRDQTTWLSDRYALASLPAVSSLKALRCFLGATGAPRPSACPPEVRQAKMVRSAGDPSLVGYGAPTLQGPSANGRTKDGNRAAELFLVGSMADPKKIRELSPLPGAEAELKSLKARYPGSVIRIRDQATETQLKGPDSAVLSQARYVIFSTHGVLGGSAGAFSASGQPILAEPGLILTPPATATALDDGYLSASEAAQLNLSADFVVLSACNTASSDGRPGAEGLSGLARAFFYAGARSVLVSHWSVSDQATTSLITETFSALEAGASRAKALQMAMRKVRAEANFANPYFWAAFELVGEPER